MIHRENLLKLARYLAGDEIAMKFDIEFYCNATEWECGTAGCAIGHAPHAGIEGIEKHGCWRTYSEVVFGMIINSDVWDWCFSCEWKNLDNTAIGAAKRIFWLLKYGLPGGWEEQITGTAPLCYCDMNISEFMDEANTEQLIGACHD